MVAYDTATGLAGNGLDGILELIAADPDLATRVPGADIAAALDCAAAMNGMILDALAYARTQPGATGHPVHVVTADTVRAMNAYIRGDAGRLEAWTAWHGDDTRDGEWGFHLVQNDGASTRLFRKNFVNTVADGIYHLGFEIDGDRFLNEDGKPNATLDDVASWITYFETTFARTGTGLDRITDQILSDPGLMRRVSAADITEGAGSANALNTLILEAALAVAGDAVATGYIMVGDVVAMNAYIQANRMAMWEVHHGDDEDGEEWGFHCVQNDGATTEMFGRNAINTVADGLYHMGFDINENGRFLNEDGNQNASVEAVTAWLNAFLFDTPLIQGTNRSETLSGTDGSEQILGEGGHDTIDGGAGDDTIMGGAGNEVLRGGAGDDLFVVGLGRTGWDTVDGGAGQDTIDGSAAAAITLGRTFSPTDGVEAMRGNGETVVLGNGWDNTWDFSATHLVGIAVLDSGNGHDTVAGTDGDDVIDGGQGNDVLDGRAGNDVFRVDGDKPGWDDYRGGTGLDTIDGTGAPTIGLARDFGPGHAIEVVAGNGETVILGNGWDNAWDFSATQLVGIAAVDSGNGHDTVIGTDGDDVIDGGSGHDVLGGGAGFDTLTGGDGRDTFVLNTAARAFTQVVTDFFVGRDTIALLEAAAYRGFDDLVLTQDGVDTVVTFAPPGDVGSLRLLGVDAEALSEGAFDFIA